MRVALFASLFVMTIWCIEKYTWHKTCHIVTSSCRIFVLLTQNKADVCQLVRILGTVSTELKQAQSSHDVMTEYMVNVELRTGRLGSRFSPPTHFFCDLGHIT